MIQKEGNYMDNKMKLVREMEMNMEGIEQLSVKYHLENIIFYPSSNDTFLFKEYMNIDEEKYYSKILKKENQIQIEMCDLRVETRERDKSFLSFLILDFNVLLEIYVPERFHGVIKTEGTNGDMCSKLKQEFSSFYAKATSGDIKIDFITAKEIDLQVNSGDIKVKKIEGNMMVTASSGDINITELNGTGCVKVSSGDIQIGIAQAQENLTFSASSGSINIEELNGTGTVKTSSGALKVILGKVKGAIGIHSTSGSLSLGIPKNLNATLTASIGSGVFHKNFDSKLVKTIDKNHKRQVMIFGNGEETNIEVSATSGTMNIYHK